MSRHYSDGRLVALGCDVCDALIAPNPNIANSVWRQRGLVERGVTFEYDYCPKHADRAACYGAKP